MPTLAEITAKIQAAVAPGSGLGKTLKLNLTDAGVVYIDGTRVTNDDVPADLTLTVSIENLLAMSSGRLDPTYAVMVGKLRSSDLGLLLASQDALNALIARLG